MRRDCQPCLVVGEKHLPLTRLEFSAKQIDELWLQKTLNKTPDVLPISELDQSFAPLVSLGREILRIDNLFVSPTGRLTLVETKLWRNPEAVRQAISQVVDYAQKLRGLSIEDLEREVKKATDATLHANQSIWELVKERYPEEVEDESDFNDALGRSLADARFMLLIVGDGIKDNLEGMVDLRHTQPQMLFSFGLVELQIYQQDAIQGKLIVPQIVAHSTEIVRAVIKVKTEGKAEVTVTVEPDQPKRDDKKRMKLSEAEFYESIQDSTVKDAWQDIISEAKDMGYCLESASASISLCLSNPFNQGKSLYMFRFTNRGEALPFTKLPEKKKDSPAEVKSVRYIVENMVKSFGEMFDVPVRTDRPRLTRRLTVQEITSKREKFLKVLKATADEMAVFFEG